MKRIRQGYKNLRKRKKSEIEKTEKQGFEKEER